MRLTFLSGGTGTPKLLMGFRDIVKDEEISVICNTGDDYHWYGLHVSPDLDTVLYLFTDRLDLSKFWGVKDERFDTMTELQNLGEEIWFNVGDKDLGLHLFRNKYLRINSLTEVTQLICEKWNIRATITPMCDQMVNSIIYTDVGRLPFQEYFVKHRWQPEVKKVEFDGMKDEVPESTLKLLDDADQIIIGPSNPVTSIGPMLSLIPLRETLSKNQDKCIAISPIIGATAFSGPSTKLMEALEIEVSPVGLARYYQGLVSTIIFDPQDEIYAEEIEELGIKPLFHPIELKTKEQKIKLAEFIVGLQE